MTKKLSKAEKRQAKQLRQWTQYLEKNPNIAVYFSAQKLSHQEAFSQFKQVESHVDVRPFKKRIFSQGVKISGAIFVASLGVGMFNPVGFAFAVMLPLAVFTNLAKSVQLAKHSAAPDYLKKVSDEFNRDIQRAYQNNIDPPFPVQKLIDKNGTPVKIVLR